MRRTFDHPKQQAIIDCTAKRIIVRAGRRGGKTTGVAQYAIRKFLAGKRVLYAAPTTDQLGKFWREVIRALGDPIKQGIYYKNETSKIVELKSTDQRIRAKTAWNAETLRGDYADVLILDEFQMMQETAWTEVGAPMLIDNNGDALFIYTPPSLTSRANSKAKDLRYAAKMFKRAKEEEAKAAIEDRAPRWRAFHFTSHDNPFISAIGIAEVSADMTQLAIRQEIEAEDTEEIPGALWNLAKMIDPYRLAAVPCALARIVVAIDPSGSSTTEAGIVAAGLGTDGHGYVLEDDSALAASPRTWAGKAVYRYHDLKADRIVGERNFGGDMVEETVRTVDENVSYSDVTASRGKMVRAEPVAALYEKGLVHHVGDAKKFAKMEEEQCSYVPGNPSPNRMDAVVWALTDLMLGSNVLGLVDYLKGGAALEQLKQLQKPPEPARPATNGNSNHSDAEALAKAADSGEIAKVMIADETPHCPECNSILVQDLPGGSKRCRQCGVQWGGAANGHKPTPGRNSLLMK